MSSVEILDQLKAVTGAFEAYHRTEYVVYRDTASGGVQEIHIEVLDAGPSKPHIRYQVTATSDEGKKATGNPSESLEVALAIVHWHDLD